MREYLNIHIVNTEMSKGIFPKNNQFCFGTSLKVNGCCFVRSYHFIKKYTPGNHTTDFGKSLIEKNTFFRALPEKGGGGPCPSLSFIYIQHISSENRILKTFWYFGAPYWSYSLLKRWKHVGQNLHLLDQAWESGWEPWWVSLSLLHKQPWCYAIKIETEKRWDLVPLWWGSRRMNN